jgi:hypothetical protein
MKGHAVILISKMADVSAAGTAMKAFVTPVVFVLGGIAGLVATFFLITGGINYMTSSGQPDKLEHAKKVIRNAIIGLVIVISATVLTGILSHAYQSSGGAGLGNMPALTAIQPTHVSGGLINVLVDAIVGLFRNIIESAATPFIDALKYFTRGTPLMAANSSVFSLWLAIVGIADALFVLVVVLLGFHIMSAATLGLDEIDFKHMLPQLALAFFLINTSIFAVDGIISLSNGMIDALYASFPIGAVWTSLSNVAASAGALSLVILLIMVAFLVLAVILVIYYVTRLVTLYVGAILSPLVVLLWLVPGFKDFAMTAVKTYLTTVFVLFVHVVILLLAASIFTGMLASSSKGTLDPIMSVVVGLATLMALLKTQGVLMQLNYASVAPKAMRKLGSQFMTGVSYISKSRTTSSSSSTKEASE